MKKFMLILMTLVVFMGGTDVFAQNTSAEALLTRDLISTAKSLKNDIKIYNYFTLGQAWDELNKEEGRKSYVNRYLSYRAGSFWNPEFKDDSPKNFAAGAGLYFAIDPSISQSYGNSFVELTMPAGTRFLNVVKAIPVKKDTMNALVTEGYLTKVQLTEIFPKLSGFYRDTLRLMVGPQYTNFRALVQNIFENNSIQFVEYNFNAALGGFCTKHSYSAFVYVGVKNPADLQNATVVDQYDDATLYSAQFTFENQSSTEQIDFARIMKFRNMLDSIASLRKAGKPYKPVISSTYSEAEVKQLKTSTYSCDN